MVHSYCMTAQIILKKSIYCEKCEFQYNLFVKEEALCSGMTSSLFMRYMFFLVSLTLFTAFILIADGMLKTASAQSSKHEKVKDEDLKPG